MRKVLSIILLLVLLFNIIGYRALFYYTEKQSDATLEARLDKNQYDENDLVSITIPLNNPYQLEQSGFERVNGEINFQGTNLKFVKRKVSDGNIILLCIPDIHKMDLKKSKSDFSNVANDLTGNNKNSSRSGLQKNFNGSDYEAHQYNFRISEIPNTAPLQHEFSLNKFSDAHIASPGKPPRA